MESCLRLQEDGRLCWVLATYSVLLHTSTIIQVLLTSPSWPGHCPAGRLVTPRLAARTAAWENNQRHGWLAKPQVHIAEGAVVHCDQSVSKVKLQFHQLQSLPVTVEAVEAVDLEEAQIVVLLSAPAPASYLINWPGAGPLIWSKWTLLDVVFEKVTVVRHRICRSWRLDFWKLSLHMCYKKLRKIKVAQNPYYSTMIGDL